MEISQWAKQGRSQCILGNSSKRGVGERWGLHNVDMCLKGSNRNDRCHHHRPQQTSKDSPVGSMVGFLKGNTTFFSLKFLSRHTVWHIEKNKSILRHRKQEVVKGHSTNITYKCLFTYVIRNTTSPLKTIV